MDDARGVEQGEDPQDATDKTVCKLESMLAKANKMSRETRAKTRNCSKFNRLFEEYEVRVLQNF